MKQRARLLAVFCLLTTSVFSQGLTSSSSVDYETAHLSRIATAVRITENITIDGQLEEPVWMQAPLVSDFIQQRPRTGEPATQRTEVRFLYDNDNLYVGVVCIDDQPENITVNSIQKDFSGNESDGVTI